MKHLPIVPAVIPKNQEEVIYFAKKLSFSPEYHLDLVDGKFVSSICWPYEPHGDAMSVKHKLDAYTLEIDLMVENPLEAASEWIKAGADMLVFHTETISLDSFKRFADQVDKVSVGISAHGETTLETLAEYAREADYIQLMGIREIGAQGLPFDEEVLNKISWLKERFPLMSITIDGSVNKNTIKRLADAGADRFICGSAIVGQPNPEEAHRNLSVLING
jgi:ribulose-phosphate 3-epimerase